MSDHPRFDLTNENIIEIQMKKWILQIFVILFLSGTAVSSYAQLPGGEPGDPGLPGDGDDIDGEDVPLDGGVMILLAAGAAYGYSKLRDGKTAGSSQPE